MPTKLGSNNPFPSVLMSEQGSTPTNPAAGYQRPFIRSSDHHLCRVDSAGNVTDIEGGGGSTVITGAVYLGTVDGRLTTETGVPVSTADRTAQSTIYFTPYEGNQIALYDGAAWVTLTFTELSLALSGLTSGKNYDVFLAYGGSPAAITLELSAAWTTDTARADALASLNGVTVKSSAHTRRHIGTIRTTGTTTTEDSAANRFVWNRYNRVRREMHVYDTTDSWNYTTASWRQMNGSTANQLAYVTGEASTMIEAVATVRSSNASATTRSNGIGIDSTTVPSGVIGQCSNAVATPLAAFYRGAPGLGYHFVAALEISNTATGTSTWVGDNGAANNQMAGIVGSIEA